MKRFAALLLVASLGATCANKKYDRLEQAEKDHYTALKVWMDAKERKAYLKLKTREERDTWLKDAGLWERFYQYDAAMRDKIMAGAVGVGWRKDQVLMAWGAEHNTVRLAGRQAARSEKVTYLFEVTPEGEHLLWSPNSSATHTAVKKYRIELFVDDGVVTEKKQVDGWL